MQDIWNSSKWKSSPIAYWTMQYEYRRSGTDMQYRFHWKVWLGSSGSWYYDGLKLKLFIDGVQKDITVKGYNSNEKGWSYEGTTEWYTVKNKTSGNVSFYAQLYDTSADTLQTTSKTFKLTVSGATSVLGTISAFNAGDSIPIKITKYDANFTDSLKVSYGTTVLKTISPITNGTTLSLTDDEWKLFYSNNKTSNKGTITFELTTKNGSTTIGTNTQTATATITDANPTFTDDDITYKDTSWARDITENPLHIVQNQSNLKVTVKSATAKKEASISKYEITVNGVTKTITSSGTVDFGKINTSTDFEINVKVTDSRGNSTTAKKTATAFAWALPVFTVSLERKNNYEDETYLTVDASISSVNGKNTLMIQYEYAERENNGIYSGLIEIANHTQTTITLDKNKSYDFNIIVSDAFDDTGEEFVVSKGKFPLFIDTRKNAVGINDFPAEGEALCVADGVARFDDGIVLKSSNKKFLIKITDSGTFSITEIQ